MKFIMVLLVTLVISGPSLAADIISEEHNCADLRALIKDRGSVIIGGSRRTRVFGSTFACRGTSSFGRDLKAIPEICPAKDTRFCNAGFKCTIDLSSDDN